MKDHVLSNRVKEVRKAYNLTQEEFSEKLGVTPNYISMVERGKRKLSQKVVKRIVELFPEERVEYLIGLDDYRTKVEAALMPAAKNVVSICHEAIQTYGVDAQVDMMIEEMSELTKALLKYRRAYGRPKEELDALVEDILEEMADVEIVLLQMRMIFGETGGYALKKLERLDRRLHDKADD